MECENAGYEPTAHFRTERCNINFFSLLFQDSLTENLLFQAHSFNNINSNKTQMH